MPPLTSNKLPSAGYLLIDKPRGISSHTAVAKVRRALGAGGRRGIKAGHTGTLDPFADGLLIVLLGRATRLMPYLVTSEKRYLVEVTFGASSSTDDRTGEIEPSDAPMPTQERIMSALSVLAARTRQIPPAVSAIHINGVRSYKRVRRGEVVDVPEREIRINRLDLCSYSELESGQVVVSLDVECGAGTYMRALARDLGDLVECPAYCSELRRTSVGEFHVDDACTPDDVEGAAIQDPIDLLRNLAIIDLQTEQQVHEILAGRRIATDIPGANIGDKVALTFRESYLVAIAEQLDNFELQPRTVLTDIDDLRLYIEKENA